MKTAEKNVVLSFKKELNPENSWLRFKTSALVSFTHEKQERTTKQEWTSGMIVKDGRVESNVPTLPTNQFKLKSCLQ